MTDDGPHDESEVSALLKLQERVESEINYRESLADDPYPFVGSNEKSLRCFIVDKYASGEYSIARGAATEIAFYVAVEQWIQTGEEPPKAPSKGKHLKSVPPIDP